MTEPHYVYCLVHTSHPYYVPGIPFYIGCTNDPATRLRDHRRDRHPGVDMRVLAEYSCEAAGYAAERMAWFSLKALGYPIENRRPTGKPWKTPKNTPAQQRARLESAVPAMHAAQTPESHARAVAARMAGGRGSGYTLDLTDEQRDLRRSQLEAAREVRWDEDQRAIQAERARAQDVSHLQTPESRVKAWETRRANGNVNRDTSHMQTTESRKKAWDTRRRNAAARSIS